MNPIQLGGEVTLSYTQLISLDVVTVDVLPEKKVGKLIKKEGKMFHIITLYLIAFL